MSKKQIFGVHSITPYNIATGKPISLEPFKVIGTFSVSLTQEIIESFGGSSFDAWGVELGARTFEGAMLLKEYPSALMEIATGTAPTVIAAEASGSVSSLINASGTSAFEATTGIASVELKAASAIDVPFASYSIEVVSPTTVDVYVSSDIDFAQGTDKTFKAGTQKVNSSPLTITSATVVDIPDFGITLTGGSGSIAMTIGNYASFSSKPANTGSRTINIGSPLARPTNIGLMAYAQRQSDGTMFEINVYSALFGGLPITLTEKAFSESEMTFKAKRAFNTFDPSIEGLYGIKEVNSSNL
jgi:hypothetical protein